MRLMIVDDDPLVCRSLKVLLEKEADIEVIGVAYDGREAVELCERQPDVILMDIQMPVMDGIDSTKRIKERYPAIPILMLTTFRDERNIRRAIQAGAAGYLLKSSAIASMADQIRAAASGTAVLSPDVLRAIVEPGREALEGLTERELDIVELVARGLSNKEISERLYLSAGTVRNMLTVVLDKLELRDRTQLAILYWQGRQP